MSFKYRVVLLWVICLSYKVVMTNGEVVLVNRNVTDSFRVGKDGCTNNASVCTISSATCEFDGSCLCSDSEPNFRNPAIIDGGGLKYGDSYGCVSSQYLRFGVGGPSNYCVFGPFQLVPYSHQDSATNFSDIDNPNVVFKSCSLQKALAKFPDNATEMELQWLNESYVDFTVFNETLHFKWKRIVPGLRGTIITLYLRCTLSPLDSVVPKCLRAKVLGTWPAEINPTGSTPVVTKAPTTSALNPTGTMTMSPTTSARSKPQGSSSDEDFSGTIIVIAVVVPVVLLIVLVVVVWWLCKRKKRNSQGNSSRGSSGKKNGTATLKKFRHTDSNLRGPDAYEDGQARDTNETFGAQSNRGYATPDSQRVVVEANSTYATPDLNRKEAKSANYNPAPGYEPVNVKKREADSQVDPGYATPDVNRRDVDRINSYPEPGYETPDVKKKEVNVATANSAYSTPDKNTREDNADVERIDVNGDLYALPDKNKNTKKNNGLNYMDPSQLASGSQDRNESQAQSGQPTEYAEVVGVMKPAPKKTKKKK